MLRAMIVMAMCGCACTGGRVLNVSTATTNTFVKVWAVVDDAGETRVAVIHKDMNSTSSAT